MIKKDRMTSPFLTGLQSLAAVTEAPREGIGSDS